MLFQFHFVFLFTSCSIGSFILRIFANKIHQSWNAPRKNNDFMTLMFAVLVLVLLWFSLSFVLFNLCAQPCSFFEGYQGSFLYSAPCNFKIWKIFTRCHYFFPPLSLLHLLAMPLFGILSFGCFFLKHCCEDANSVNFSFASVLTLPEHSSMSQIIMSPSYIKSFKCSYACQRTIFESFDVRFCSLVFSMGVWWENSLYLEKRLFECKLLEPSSNFNDSRSSRLLKSDMRRKFLHFFTLSRCPNFIRLFLLFYNFCCNSYGRCLVLRFNALLWTKFWFQCPSWCIVWPIRQIPCLFFSFVIDLFRLQCFVSLPLLFATNSLRTKSLHVFFRLIKRMVFLYFAIFCIHHDLRK